MSEKSDKKTSEHLLKTAKLLEEEEVIERGGWSNQFEFFLSCVAYAVGIGNVWRFPYLAYKNGGAAFVIPYGIMLLCGGLPLFFMELALGQYVSLGPNVLFGEIAPIFAGVGWAMIMISALTAIHFNIILAWTFFYTFASFNAPLPWHGCNHDFNTPSCYPEDEASMCLNQSLFYYDKNCMGIDEYCATANLDGFNDTYCINPNDTSIIQPASEVHDRIIAAEDYFMQRMMRYEGRTWEDMGSMNWELAGCLFLAWAIVAASLIKGVQSSGKVVYFTATFPFLVLLILLVRGVTLEGAYKGIEFYMLKPNMTRLQEVDVWREAATQIFYSLSASFGGLITLASYNQFKNNCMRDAIIVSFINCGTSFLAGFAVFGILGFLANELGVEVEEVVKSGAGLAFIAYPSAVIRMPVPTFWAIIFFFMLVTLGLGSQFAYVETLTTSIFDQWESTRKYKGLVVVGVCFAMFLCGLTMCLEGGFYMFELFFTWSAGLSVLFVALMEILAVIYFFGFERLINIITEEMGIHMPRFLYYYWKATWCFITPVSLTIILILSVTDVTPAQFGDYIFPNNIQVLAWCLLGCSVILIPIFAVYVVLKGEYRGKELFQPTARFCPAHIRKIREMQRFDSEKEKKNGWKCEEDSKESQDNTSNKTSTLCCIEMS